MAQTDADAAGRALIVGASRGLGHAIVCELFDRGWHVLGTARDVSAPSPLRELAQRSGGRVTIDELDITDQEAAASLRRRLAGAQFDMLFVAAGTTNNEQTPIGAVTTDDFVEVMVTNALGPMRVVETLEDLVTPAGLIGAMSSGQGSITNNTTGLREVYRGSKAALNMFLASFAARQRETRRAFLLLAPGWIRTALGGDNAPFTIEETIGPIVDVLIAKRERPGLEYLDRFGATVPW